MFPLRDTIPSTKPPIFVVAIIVVNILAFFLELGQGKEIEGFIATFGLIPDRTLVAFQEAPTLLDAWLMPFFTSMFLHGGWFHIIGNMWFLWIFGDNVEDKLGHFGFFFFYLSAGIVAALAQIASSPESIIPMVGASGAIAGVLGAYMIFFPQARVVTFIPIFLFPWFIRVPAIFFLGIWFFEQIWAGGMSVGSGASSGVAWWAHAGGFVWGVLVALVFKSLHRDPPVEVVDEDWFPKEFRGRYG